MSTDPAARHARLMALFQEICDLDPVECQKRLSDVATEDRSLADELKALLAFDTKGPDDVLDITRRGAIGAAALGVALAADRGEQPLPDKIGRYRIIKKLGEGGMGTVLEAEQSQPKRRVALKVLRADLAGERMRRRFQAEAEALARLTHPGIARVYEAVVDGAEPYLVMELVHGEALDDYIAAHHPSLCDKVTLLARIADAVDHAHKNGVVHRDLKPPNILVEAGLAPKVLDFGIARVLDADTQPGDRMTRSGEIMGTPAYMSPEQTMLDPERIDHRTDVYALGVIAYQVLAGRMPYPIDRSDLVKAFTTIRELEPIPAGKVRRELGGDLEVILKTALAKDPERRYASAAALADDFRRWLAHEPIRARRPSAWYQLSRFARRNRVLVASLGILFAVLVAGVIVSTSLWLSGEEARAELAHRVDELVLLQARSTLDDDPTRAVGWLGDLSPDASWDRAWAVAWDAVGRGVSSAILRGTTSDVEWVDADPEGGRVVSAGYDGTVRLWDLATGDGRILSGHSGEVNRAMFSPDGSRIASAGRDGLVGVWRARDGVLLARLEAKPGEPERGRGHRLVARRPVDRRRRRRRRAARVAAARPRRSRRRARVERPRAARARLRRRRPERRRLVVRRLAHRRRHARRRRAARGLVARGERSGEPAPDRPGRRRRARRLRAGRGHAGGRYQEGRALALAPDLGRRRRRERGRAAGLRGARAAAARRRSEGPRVRRRAHAGQRRSQRRAAPVGHGSRHVAAARPARDERRRLSRRRALARSRLARHRLRRSRGGAVGSALGRAAVGAARAPRRRPARRLHARWQGAGVGQQGRRPPRLAAAVDAHALGRARRLAARGGGVAGRQDAGRGRDGRRPAPARHDHARPEHAARARRRPRHRLVARRTALRDRAQGRGGPPVARRRRARAHAAEDDARPSAGLRARRALAGGGHGRAAHRHLGGGAGRERRAHDAERPHRRG
ncbi:MAG: serine/threonine-protein kinase [Myxococcota bacterium]